MRKLRKRKAPPTPPTLPVGFVIEGVNANGAWIRLGTAANFAVGVADHKATAPAPQRPLPPRSDSALSSPRSALDEAEGRWGMRPRVIPGVPR